MSDAALAAAEPRRGPRRPRLLPFAPALTVAALVLPVALGLAGALAPAFRWLWRADVAPFESLAAWPGLAASLALTATTGLAATALSLAIALAIAAAWSGTRAFRAMERALSPLLAVPHAAAAIGLAFLIAPSGWLARLLSPWATGWERPPDWLIVGDPAGLALIAGLVVKEVPFLLLMIIAAAPQADARRSTLAARALGRRRGAAWLAAALPRVYPQIRLPVYAVLAYSLSTVDMAAVLGPAAPSTLALEIVGWMRDPDLSMRLRAAEGAALLLALALAAIALWRLGEIAVARLGEAWIVSGRGLPRGGETALAALGLAGAGATAGLIALGLAGLAVWSVAGFWSFPDALPSGFTAASWARAADGLGDAAGETLLIGAAATLAALALAIGCLEAEHRYGLRPGARGLGLLYLPLIAPQASFLIGLQGLALSAGFDGGRWAVTAAHVVFCAPYVFLSLAAPWRAWDARYATAAAALGASPDRVLWRVRMPMLLRPALTAAAVGFAVSVGQYLPTLLIGGGRVETLATEAVALAAGGDRRLVGAYALSQAALPCLGFALALGLPALLHRERRGLRG